MTILPTRARVCLITLGAVCLLVGLALKANAAPPEKPALRVSVAPVADRRTLTFPDSLPLEVEAPLRTLTAQPRSVPEQVHWRLKKVLASMDGLAVVEAPQLGAYPKEEVVRAAAELNGIDAVLVSAVTVGYGQMQEAAFRRRYYKGRVLVELHILSGRTGRSLTDRLVLEGYDEIDVDFRRPMDFDTLHHRGAGPEIRERTYWAVREVGNQLKEKLSAAWLEAVLAEEGRVPEAQAEARLAIKQVGLEPASPKLGRTARMIISYELSGLAPGAVINVTETRRLVHDGQLVAGPFQTVNTLGNGNYTSTQDLHVPATAGAGLYTILGQVEAGEARADGSSSFTVLAPQ